ncbi:CRISPR-associated endonuclease Cas1 [Crossiella sp. SN42]|uniref:CRISPR-associated endonuclease Cas1 n=1 Tax=Crossiella sp. SN42 TaxID=2944808 RepID=UPI00207C850A|nr:CRISPR-associated endonuclease Cas1 [Crossiella sp. SN42]MCO1575118.1 CRISPR-associated endonuclease Cas1 [Crossiella sp. SN42]
MGVQRWPGVSAVSAAGCGVLRGKPFHVAGADCVLTRRGGRLVAFRDGQPRASAPLSMVSEVVLTGPVSVTTAVMHLLLRNGVPLILLSGTGRPLGRMEPPSAPHIQARTRQLDLHRDPATRLAVAARIVSGKIHNQGVLLRRRARRSLDPDAVWTVVNRLAKLEETAGSVTTLPALLGVEGAAAGAYFGVIRGLVVPGHGFSTRDRAGRDVVNQLLNYCSALLRETVVSALLCAGLDPFLSFLHTPARGRLTLAFDLMEEWRPVLLESTVLALLGLGTATAADIEDGRLTRPVVAAAINRFQTRLAAPARGWPAVAGGVTYGEVVRRQSLRLRAHLLDPASAYEPFRWR